MNTRDEQFTPDDVDEQIHHLAQVQHDQFPMTPGMQLIRDLHSLHQEDARIAERVWNRLETYAALGERITEKEHLVERQKSHPERKQLVGNTDFNSPTKGSLYPRLGMLAATLFLVLLVGSMAFVFNAAHQNKIAHQTPHGQTGVGRSSQPPEQTGVGKSSPAPEQTGLYATLADGIYQMDPVSGKVRWHYSISRESEYSNTELTVSKGGVYFGANDQNGHHLYALNAFTGSLLWQKTLDYSVMSQPLVVNDIVYVGTIAGTENSVTGGHVYALNARDGSLHWSYATDGGASVGGVQDGVVYASTATTLFALNANDGKQLWSIYLTAKDQAFIYIQLVANVLYVSSTENSHHGQPGQPSTQYCYQYAYNPTNGTQLWRSQAVDGYVLSPATIAGDTVYFSSQNGNVYALNTKDGTQRWSYNAGGPVYLSPVLDHGLVYVINIKDGTTDRLIALDVTTGNQLWSQPGSNNRCDGQSSGSLIASGNLLYCGSGYHVNVLSASNGTLVKSYQISDEKYGFITPQLLLVK